MCFVRPRKNKNARARDLYISKFNKNVMDPQKKHTLVAKKKIITF